MSRGKRLPVLSAMGSDGRLSAAGAKQKAMAGVQGSLR